MPTPVTEEKVRDVLNSVIDPCSTAAGAPAGLDDMGLVRSVTIRPEADGALVSVVLGITEPACLMGLPFQATAFERLSQLEGVARVEVTLDEKLMWTEAELSPAYARRLADVRLTRRERLKVIVAERQP